jgi:hypothetical protein
MGHCVQNSGTNTEQHSHVIRALFRKRVVYGFKPLLKYGDFSNKNVVIRERLS